MGKERRLRQKYHLAAVKTKSEEKKVKFAVDVADKPQVGTAARQSTLFSGLDINLNDLTKSLTSVGNSVDTETTPTGNNNANLDRNERLQLKNANISKKEKMKLRHLAFLQKIQVVQEARKKVKATKHRQKTVITGDMHPLLDSLPTLASVLVNEGRKIATASSDYKMSKVVPLLRESKPLSKDSNETSRNADLKINDTKRKKGPKMKTHKQLQKQMLSDMEIFRQVKDHPEFKKKPEATILKHLHNKFKF